MSVSLSTSSSSSDDDSILNVEKKRLKSDKNKHNYSILRRED